MYYIPRGGNRGGADQFTWTSVKTDKDREYYLGHSLKAPVGRWQDGRDLQWFNKTRKDGDSMADERRAIKQAEEEAMMAALGQKVVKHSPNAASSTQQNLDPAASEKGQEDKLKKRSKRSHVKSMKKHKKEKAKKKSRKRRNRHSSSDSSTESSDSSSSDESEKKVAKHRRKQRPRNSGEDETRTNEMSRVSKNHGVLETPSQRHKHHDDSVNHTGSHRHSDRPPEKHSERPPEKHSDRPPEKRSDRPPEKRSERPPEKRRDRDTDRQRESDSPSKRRRPSDSAHHAKRDTDLPYKHRERGKHPPRR